MRLPVLRGVVDRRILANYRVDPEALRRLLPPPFRPQIIRGVGMAGICLIRLKAIRPLGMPAFLGVSSENAAHRIAVEWDADGVTRQGVYIPRRDTSSRLNSFVGGRIFPGEHHLGRFDVEEREGRFRVALAADDGQTRLAVDGTLADDWPAGSIFESLAEASDFFAAGSLDYSATCDPCAFDGLELRTANWNVRPLDVTSVASSFFDDVERFPPGAVEFDCALLMRGVEHEWHGRETLRSRPLATAS